MVPTRTYRRRWVIGPAVLASVGVQAGAVAAYVLTMPAPEPQLTIRLQGEGRGTVLVTREGDTAPVLRCASKEAGDTTCRLPLAAGTRVRLTAVLDEGATFGGYQQLPMRTPPELVGILGDPLAPCLDLNPDGSVPDVMDCAIRIDAITEVRAEFGWRPDRVEVELGNAAVADAKKVPDAPAPPMPIDAEKLEEKPLEVAIAPPPPELKPPQLQPPPPPEKAPPPPPPQQPMPNMVMVEVKDDKSVVDKAPDDATKLSDKNRDVAEETRANETNLDKESEGKQVASAESDIKSNEVGGPDDKIRQLEDTKPTTDKRVEASDHSGHSHTAEGAIKGDGGDNGDEGTGENKSPGMLSMRGIEGRGAVQDQGGDGRKAGRKGQVGINTPLSFNDYERIVGKDAADKERDISARKMSAKKGRWERKLEAIKSSLENFVPDVRTGNQTALKTRAHPFALYVARMHRRIHELWGFGYLEHLDDKGASDPLNNLDLWVNLEVSVNTDGTVHKVTIAKTSGKTEFDVAAIDTVLSSAPYEATPEAIRSSDGRVYLRWGFYRNWKQCGTFNVEPYILTDLPPDSGAGTLDDGAMVRNTAKLPGKKEKLVTPDDGKAKEKATPSSSVNDKEALFAANQWVAAFTTGGVDKLVSYSTVPFYAGGKVAAATAGDLKDMYSGLVVESGALRDWKLLSASEYGKGGSGLPEGNVVLQVRTTKESFAVVLTKTKSGDYRATQLAR